MLIFCYHFPFSVGALFVFYDVHQSQRLRLAVVFAAPAVARRKTKLWFIKETKYYLGIVSVSGTIPVYEGCLRQISDQESVGGIT